MKYLNLLWLVYLVAMNLIHDNDIKRNLTSVISEV